MERTFKLVQSDANYGSLVLELNCWPPSWYWGGGEVVLRKTLCIRRGKNSVANQLTLKKGQYPGLSRINIII